MLTLAGCFRQADEPFESVDSQSAGQSIPATASLEITIIDPNATNVPAPTVENQALEPEATNTLVVINPNIDEATATEAVILPPTSTPLTIPTATEASFVTPEAPVEVLIPTATEQDDVEVPTLAPTPTAEGDEELRTSNSECEYIVQSGDNLFRIAINNGISLAALLRENDLSEASIIQPNQVITIPNCDDGDTGTVEEESTEEAATEEPPSDCEYTIVSGDTLYDIAIELDVSLKDLLELNDLAETSIIQPDEVLLIPDCVDADGNATSTSSGSGTDIGAALSTVTIHTVTGNDTLLSIAQLYGVTVNDIIQNNSISDPNNLSVGQQLLIPELEN
jgi:LysM repeat protein